MVFGVVDDESANSVINLGAAHYITRWLVRNTKTKKKTVVLAKGEEGGYYCRCHHRSRREITDLIAFYSS